MESPCLSSFFTSCENYDDEHLRIYLFQTFMSTALQVLRFFWDFDFLKLPVTDIQYPNVSSIHG